MAAGTEQIEREMIEKSKRMLAQTTDLMERIRLKCLMRGASGIKGIGKKFMIVDDNRNGQIDKEEFEKMVNDFSLGLTAEETKQAFDLFDKDKSGSIDYNEFLVRLRGPMSAGRLKKINEAFDKFDKDGNGVVTADDMKRIYNCRNHPKYQNGEMTEKEIFELYLRSFDSPSDPDGIITRDEFIDYYRGISAGVDEDAKFDYMIRMAWKL